MLEKAKGRRSRGREQIPTWLNLVASPADGGDTTHRASVDRKARVRGYS